MNCNTKTEMQCDALARMHRMQCNTRRVMHREKCNASAIWGEPLTMQCKGYELLRYQIKMGSTLYRAAACRVATLS